MTYKHDFVDDYPYISYASTPNSTVTSDEDAAQFDSRLDTLEGKFPIQTDSIGDAQVTADKLASNAVETAKIKDGAVTTDKIADAAVTADKLAPSEP